MTTSKELTLPQRAAVALGTAEHEIKLLALAKGSTDITAVIDQAGRDQAHHIGMTLRAARTNITKTGKAARDDATAFGKAVIAEEKRLVAIIEPEEERVLVLRDAFDAKVQAEKDAKIAAERARIEAIQSDIQSIRHAAIKAVGLPAITIYGYIEDIEDIENLDAIEDRFAEFARDAGRAIVETLDALFDLHSKAIAAEAEAARQQAEREAAEAKAKQDREELAAAQAKLKDDQEAAAAEQAALRAEIEKRAAIEHAAIAEQQRIAMAAQVAAKAERDRIAAEHAQKMAEQQAAMDARQRDMDHAEGLMLNAQFDQLAAARKLEEETAAAAVVENVAAHVVETPRFDIYVGHLTGDKEIIWLVANEYDISFLEAISRIESIDFNGMTAAYIEESQA